MRLRRIAPGLFLAILLLVLLAAFLPLKSWLGSRIETALTSYGFQNVHFDVSGIGPGGIALKNFSAGGTTPLRLDEITVAFSPISLLSGQVRTVTLKGLAVDIRKEGENWIVTGFDLSGPPSANRTTLPVAEEALNAIPLGSIQVESSHMHVANGAMQIDIPVDLTWAKSPAPAVTYAASGITLKAGGGAGITTGSADLQASLNKANKQWAGEWHIKDIKLSGFGQDVPLLNGDGTLSAGEDTVMLQGQLASADQSYKASFRLDYFLNEPDKSTLSVIEARMPWQGGVLSSTKISIPVSRKATTNFALDIHQVALASLLQQLTGKETAATGAISGTLPVSIGVDGNITVQAGKLAAEAPGVITLPADTIPGDNPQVALARDVLKNLHYSTLSIAVDQDTNNKLSVMMNLNGNNPDVYEGRAVNLNVHLTGDVLNFIQQNLMLLTNPRQLLQQGHDAKH